MSPPAICCGTTPSLVQNLPGNPPMRNLQPLEIVNGIDLLAEPAAHLAAGIAADQRGDVELLVEIIQQIHATADGSSRPGSGAGSGRTRPRCRRRRSDPCRNSNRTRCGRFRQCRSAQRPTPASAGTISPPANTWIWNLLSVASATLLAMTSAPPYSVSSDFGQLEVIRHLISGIDWAIAGAATALAATPSPAAFKKLTTFHSNALPSFFIAGAPTRMQRYLIPGAWLQP